MTRGQINNGFLKIEKAFVISGLSEVIYQSSRKSTAPPLTLIVDSYQKFRSFADANFGDVEYLLLKIFDLEPFLDPALVNAANHISGEKRRTAPELDITTLSYNLRQFLRYTPKILKTFDQDGVNQFKLSPENRDSKYRDKELLTVILPEDNGAVSTPDRLIGIIDSINILYSVCSRVNDYKELDLSEKAIDSGRDKTFDILGAAKNVECV